MKLLLSFLPLLFLAIVADADENWIPITPLEKTQTPKPTAKLDVHLSQIVPLNKMIKNATVIKQLIDATSKKEEPATHNKNWFILNSENSSK